ncbi:tyrosine-type recombinase/integrase, partial [Phocaeicola sp.]|uniref:tyrosine-type recombinase/integrase n=1 Tax=Phocaeicola sp. TaxID=2773926 RepID=UPI003AF1456A
MREQEASPHTRRHITTTHLLLSRVDINTIRAWLGHVSINMTNIYAEINRKVKADALATLESPKK